MGLSHFGQGRTLRSPVRTQTLADYGESALALRGLEPEATGSYLSGWRHSSARVERPTGEQHVQADNGEADDGRPEHVQRRTRGGPIRQTRKRRSSTPTPARPSSSQVIATAAHNDAVPDEQRRTAGTGGAGGAPMAPMAGIPIG